MLTRWGRELDADAPLPEHPRPQLVRPTWASLNGRWDYAITDSPTLPQVWDGEIVVPFSPETVLSGVERQLQPDEWLFYRRRFVAPADRFLDPTRRLLLHFGAVDQQCMVWVDGVEVGAHTGGYLPFTLDITEAVETTARSDTGREIEHTLVVRVRDRSELAPHARGKQRLDRGRIWYTAQSGIWQSVWLEVVPACHITGLDIRPDLRLSRFDITSRTSDGATQHHRVAVEPHLWTPTDPYLHHFEITVGEDTVATYAALREFGRTRDRFTLNGRPIQHIGVLDQGYWPDGLLTAPSDAAIVHDITTMKTFGFNMLRKHVKIEPLRWYYHCDRLGMIVWQDMVNGGGRYRHLIADRPARRWTPVPDRLHALYFRGDRAARAEFVGEVRETVALLRNSACIAVWTPFNEGWGQFDANAIARLVKRLDPTRLVNHVSGWVDQGGGDIRSFHSYLRPFRLPRRRGRRLLALTEYGGHSLRVEGHDWSSREFGYRRHRTPDQLAAAFRALHEHLGTLVPAGLAATAYTQLSDVEDELNGLLTWDREVCKLDPDTVAQALAALNPPADRPTAGRRAPAWPRRRSARPRSLR